MCFARHAILECTFSHHMNEQNKEVSIFLTSIKLSFLCNKIKYSNIVPSVPKIAQLNTNPANLQFILIGR